MVEQKGLKPAGDDSLARIDNAAEVNESDHNKGQLMKAGQGEGEEE